MIVDEPTAVLDPAERVRFLNLLSELGENSVDGRERRFGRVPGVTTTGHGEKRWSV